mgnify:FL=1
MSAKKQKLKQLSKEDADNLLERSKYSLELVNTWINNADTKVGISCAIMTFIFGIIAFVAENLLFEKTFEGEPNGTLMVCFKASMAVAVILFILFLLFHFLAIKPRLFLEKPKKEEKATFSIFYAKISKCKNANEFMMLAKNADKVAFIDEILKEIFINSKICTTKMTYFKIGLWSAIVGLFFAILTCALWYIAHL